MLGYIFHLGIWFVVGLLIGFFICLIKDSRKRTDDFVGTLYVNQEDEQVYILLNQDIKMIDDKDSKVHIKYWHA